MTPALATLLASPTLAKLLDVLPNARLVGGCVRDALLGRPVKDIDLAVPYPPEQTMRLLREAAIEARPTGLDHGTVTAIVDGQSFEVTSLRRDTAQDGRHAVVIYTEDWREDAARRDLTINALSVDRHGELHDYVGGFDDLRNRRVRFVGEPEMRMREDYLRILRFFRFHAFYGEGPPDPDASAAAERLAGNLVLLSAERVTAEILRLLEAPRVVSTWQVMVERGIIAHVLPGAVRLDRLARLVAAEERLGFSPSPIRRLCAVIAPIDRPKALAILRLSGAQQKAIAMTEAVSDLSTDAALRAAMYWLGAAPVIDHLLIDQPEGWENHLAWARGWAMPSFPLTGKHLIDLGVAPGPQMGALLARVERWWIGEDFRPGRAECLAYLRTLIGSKAM